MLDTQSQRECKSCKETKPLTEEFFRRRTDRAGGFRYKCLSCELEEKKEHYRQNRSKYIKLAVDRQKELGDDQNGHF